MGSGDEIRGGATWTEGRALVSTQCACPKRSRLEAELRGRKGARLLRHSAHAHKDREGNTKSLSIQREFIFQR